MFIVLDGVLLGRKCGAVLKDEGRKEDGVPNSGDSILSSTDGGADRGQLATLRMAAARQLRPTRGPDVRLRRTRWD